MVKVSNEQLAVQFPQLSDIKELKTGGQKAVYDAVHADHGAVVLKIVTHSGDDHRVLREVEIVKNNSFPNVPSIYECGNVTFNGTTFFYICEQKITGTDLRVVLETHKMLPLPTVLDYLESMLNTVVKLEEQGIIHRDIKPDNILRDDQGRYWLIDFGIARDINNVSLTETSANFGPHTAGYAPPEQFRNLKRQIDSRADLFSIGVVAYEMLHGENPFLSRSNNRIDVLLKTETLTEDPLAISGDSKNELSGFIQTLMQKHHTYRPPSAVIALSWFSEIVKTLDLEMN